MKAEGTRVCFAEALSVPLCGLDEKLGGQEFRAPGWCACNLRTPPCGEGERAKGLMGLETVRLPSEQYPGKWMLE